MMAEPRNQGRKAVMMADLPRIRLPAVMMADL